MSSKPASAMIETLTAIWQRVLQKSSVGCDDKFFDLGGTLRAADLLFAEIARDCGRELPSSTIYHAPTIAALASLLEQPRSEQASLPEFLPVVPIKPGCEKPPILIVHGLAGTVPFFGLAKHIRTGHPVYGIQAKGVDGLEEPLESIESMAALYLDSVKRLQPRGPYVLIGYSFGGLVALEMAQRLTADGEKIALLVLVDAYPHARYLSPGQRLSLVARRIRRRIFDVRHSWNRVSSFAAIGVERGLRIAGVERVAKSTTEESRLSFAQTALRVKEKAYVALDGYRPRFYNDKIKFVKSESDAYYPADPAGVWSSLAAEFEFETVPGGHLDMVTTDFEGLAHVLTRYVREALRPEAKVGAAASGPG